VFKKKIFNRGLLYLALIVFAVVSFFPVVWMFITSIKTSYEIYSFPVVYIPSKVTLRNYISVFLENPFGKFFLNSCIVAGTSTIICLVLSVLTAYGLSRFNLKVSLLILVFFLGCFTIPYISNIIPLFIIYRRFGLLNSYVSLILPYAAYNLPFGVWFCTAYFRDIPKSIEDAAKIDGCSRFGMLWYILLPLAKPVISTVSIITFVWCWNEFLYALIMISKNEVRTIPAGITLYPGEYEFPWNTISAATIIAIIPIILFILIFQKKIISGLTSGAVKY